MKMNVPTSNIDYVDWHEGSMDMKFDNGKFVRYFDVPEGYAEAMIQAPPAGSFFNRHIDSGWTSEKTHFFLVTFHEPGPDSDILLMHFHVLPTDLFEFL